jgi:MoxR-like ATPase
MADDNQPNGPQQPIFARSPNPKKQPTHSFSPEELDTRCYEASGKRHSQPLKGAWERYEPYVAPDLLKRAVNMAIYLRRPLLLEGEPGTGKTRLAYAVAYELGYPLKEISVRSTDEARDLLYEFDAIQRLYDIQEHSAEAAARAAAAAARRGTLASAPDDSPVGGKPDTGAAANLSKYVKLGELGEAIELAECDTPSVVLIDEIDKADIDFPNDLLLVLDRLQFTIDELDERHDALYGHTRAERRPFLPIVIITSNREKELPPAFLRRCLYYFIPFPKTTKEVEPILETHFRTKVAGIYAEALARFMELREMRWRKPPSTSELIDWVAMLERDAAGDPGLIETLRLKKAPELPYLEALLKTQSDREALTGKTA